jgi:hypothetical protein
MKNMKTESYFSRWIELWYANSYIHLFLWKFCINVSIVNIFRDFVSVTVRAMLSCAMLPVIETVLKFGSSNDVHEEVDRVF